MQGKRHPPETRQRVVALLRDGHSVNETARQTGVSASSGSSIGREAGVRLAHARGERIREAARDFDHIARLEAINALAARIRELVEESDDLTARELRDASVVLGVAIDKARLERGEATARTDQRQAVVHFYIPDDGLLDPATLSPEDRGAYWTWPSVMRMLTRRPSSCHAAV